MLDRTMNKAMEAISAMSFEGQMMFLSIAMTVPFNKDLLEKEVQTSSKRVNSRTQASKVYSPKHIRKDKSKHGYHNGARKDGSGSYDKWGKPEKVAKDGNKDLKTQMMELDELSNDITLNEAVSCLASIYSPYYFGDFHMDLVYYHNSDWYDYLGENISMVENIYQGYFDKLAEIQINLYQSAETLFPEMGMAFQNLVVEKYNSMVMKDLNTMKDRMVHWLVCRYKDNREYEMMNEAARHDIEVDRLNKLMKEAEKYIK